MGSVHNELTGRAGFIARALRNALQIEDGSVGIERVSETLTPTINLWERPEWALLRGERLWAVAPQQLAVAAEFSQVGIFNPANSNLIVVVKEFYLGFGAQNVFDILIGTLAGVAFTGTSTPNSRDTRTALMTGIQCGSFTHHNAARVGTVGLGSFSWNTFGYHREQLDVVLTPGFFIAVGPNVVNQASNVSFFGYERPAFAGELTARA